MLYTLSCPCRFVSDVSRGSLGGLGLGLRLVGLGLALGLWIAVSVVITVVQCVRTYKITAITSINSIPSFSATRSPTCQLLM